MPSPNILFIAVDDLNDWVGHLGGHPQTKTPNIDRLAARGVSFTQAFCNAPLCNPSRASLLTGIFPHKSGIYGNGEQLRDKLAEAVTLIDPSGDQNFAAEGGDHHNVLTNHQWKRAVRSYLATIHFVDAQIGRLLDALERSEHADKTIVVLWGDHGWHLGEKQHWRKHALWEVTTHTTLILSAPKDVAVDRLCHRPVSLVDLYPTLLDLCGLPDKDGLDGRSLAPLLKDPTRAWDHPVLITYGFRNHAVQTERWRYIRYRDGGEEFYDHAADPREWTNLAADGQYQQVIRDLQKSLPAVEQP